MTVALTNVRRAGYAALAEIMTPPPPIDYEAWAIRNIAFTARESDFPGPYNPDLFPFFTEIYRALSPEDPCRIVTVRGSAQVGKTTLANVFTLGSLELDPCDFFYVHPTEDNARRWSKLKLAAMIRNSEVLRKAFPEKSRDGGDSIMFKERADGRGSVTISGANSPSSLSQVSMRRQVQDDLSKWKTNDAGDPEIQADSRSRAFEFAKIFKISTPLVMPGCRITKAFEAGSQEAYYVPCPHCGHKQTLEIENLLENLDDKAPEKAAFSCIECGAFIEQHQLPAAVRAGEWIARNPDAKREHRSFELWSAYSPLQTLERVAREWLSARGAPDKERVFYNDTAGKPYKVKGEAPPWEELRNRAATTGHRRASIPAPGLLVTIGVDVNGDWLNWQAVAWTRDHRRFVIDYGRIDAAINESAAHAALDKLLVSKWRHESGRDIGCDLLAIDGNFWTEDVWTWAKRHPVSKVVMVRGVDGDDKPLIARVKRERDRKTGKPLKYSARFYNFATSILKWSLYRNLPLADPLVHGYVGFPRGLDDEYFRELTSERRVEKKARDGTISFGWHKDEEQRNEALDTMLQAEAAAIKRGVRDMPPAVWDQLEAERASLLPNMQLDFEDGSALLVAASPPPAASPAPSQTKPAPPRRKLSDIGF